MKNLARLFTTLGLVGASLLAIGGCASRTVIVARPGPPPGPVVVAPGPGAVWIPAHWAWRPYWGRYVWVRGHWR